MKNQLKDLKKVAEDIRSLVMACVEQWSDLTEDITEKRPTQDSWSPKEIIGHLIDSASNNHQRFVRLQIFDVLTFPDYSKDNEKWVKVQRYQEKNWNELLLLWQYFNLHLAWVIQTVSPDVLNHIWRLDDNTQVSLRDMMIDYLRHLRVHVDQVNAIM